MRREGFPKRTEKVNASTVACSRTLAIGCRHECVRVLAGTGPFILRVLYSNEDSTADSPEAIVGPQVGTRFHQNQPRAYQHQIDPRFDTAMRIGRSN